MVGSVPLWPNKWRDSAPVLLRILFISIGTNRRRHWLKSQKQEWKHQQTRDFNEFVQAKSLQSCLTLCKPVDYSPPSSSVHGILQARIREWVALPSSRGSSSPRANVINVDSVNDRHGRGYCWEKWKELISSFYGSWEISSKDAERSGLYYVSCVSCTGRHVLYH